MIERVMNLTKKSFVNYSGPIEKFKLKNIIFGYNGRGKSSLALGLKDKHLSGVSTESNNLRFLVKIMLKII